MQFISPGSLYGEKFEPLPDKKSLQLERKKLLAELEINGTDTITIHQITLTKSDIISYFDGLQTGETLKYYQVIERDRVLLLFLEEQFIDYKQKFNKNDLYYDNQFINWVSPYFSTAFKSFAGACFKQIDSQALKTMLDNHLLMTDEDTEACLTFIGNILNNNIARINYYAEQGKQHADAKVPLETVSLLMGSAFVRMIKLLPEKRFGEIRDVYAFAIMQACIYAFNKNVQDREWAKTILEHAALLAFSPEMKDTLQQKLDEMNRITAKSKKKQSFLIFRLVFVALFIIVKLATCADTDSAVNYKFQNTPVYYGQPRDSSQPQLDPMVDSALRAIRKKDDSTDRAGSDKYKLADTTIKSVFKTKPYE